MSFMSEKRGRRPYTKHGVRNKSLKEVRYFTLLTNIEGFIGKSDSKKVAEFYEHYRTAWLYAPDEVIFAINKFFKAVGAQNTELIDTDIMAGNMVWEMRKDFYRDTTLTAEDFLIISPKEG